MQDKIKTIPKVENSHKWAFSLKGRIPEVCSMKCVKHNKNILGSDN
jgi:hypothetical protein